MYARGTLRIYRVTPPIRNMVGHRKKGAIQAAFHCAAFTMTKRMAKPHSRIMPMVSPARVTMRHSRNSMGWI